MPSVTREAATLFRLDRHHLNNRAKREHLAKVVSDICGVQAQLMSAAELSLWTRVDGLQREEIGDVLFNKHTLVKTWCMRGACHIIASADLPILVGGISRYGLQREKAWLSKRGISETEMDKTVKILVETLADETLTREELADRVAARIGSKAKRWIENSWGGIVKQACLQGLVVFGPNRGKNITFVRRTTWLPTVKDLPAKNAEEQLLLRYLSGYGPASLSDFSAWSGMTVGEAAAIKERVSDAVAEIDIEGKNCLIAKKDLG
ncbi:MAG: crosslink repair DNA glycosylase YcaQ family protein, partial [Candidatus Bathyarchaeia archaeon]